MIRTYIDNKGLIHNYNYDKDKMIGKAKCNKCHRKMNYVFGNRLGKHIKLGFVCFQCNTIFINQKYLSFKCNVSILPIKRIKC